ncbi:hypothetical protein SALBM135S_05888 [Streptomyces alboniger]
MAEKDEKTSAPAAPVVASTQGAGSRPAPADTEDRAAPEGEDLAVDPDQPGIDPRLDNRTGHQRPKLEEFPAKPQQIDGPELGQEKRVTGKRRAAGPRKGAKSPGPHGLGDTADQV